jgi:4-alpha-glucanotransferase
MPSYRTPANGADRTALLEHFAARIEHEARRVGPGGLIRLDHLLGAAEQYAIDVSGGGQSGYRALFSAPEWRALMDRFPEVSFVGEDLGELTPTRDAFMRELDPPRMRVGLQAFMESWGDVREGSHFADNVGERDVMYSGGTHDYPFLRSYLSDHWHDNGVRQLRDVLAERGYIAGAGSASLDDVARGAMQLSYDSPAGTVITQVFDALGMGGSSDLPAHLRAFNSPGAAGGMNWATRIPADTLLPGVARARLVDTLASMARLSRRA